MGLDGNYDVDYKDTFYRVCVDGIVRLSTMNEDLYEAVWQVMCENYPESLVEVWKESSELIKRHIG
jgi:hypothetical protein